MAFMMPGSTFDSRALNTVIQEQDRWNRHTKEIVEENMICEHSEKDAMSLDTRDRLVFRSEMHDMIKKGFKEADGSVGKAISTSHSSVYRRALRDLEVKMLELKEQENKDLIIETCMVHNKQYFENVKLKLRLASGSVFKEHYLGTVDTSTLRPLITPQQMEFFKKVKELGSIINKAICNRNQSHLASPKNINEALNNLFTKHLMKEPPVGAPVIHLTLTHDMVVDYTEVERTNAQSIANGAHVNLSFEIKSAKYAFAECTLEHVLPFPENIMSFFDVIQALETTQDAAGLCKACYDFTMYYNFDSFHIDSGVIQNAIMKNTDDPVEDGRARDRTWFQIFRDAELEKISEDSRVKSYLHKFEALDNCANDLPELKAHYISSPKVVMFHIKTGPRVNKYWFCADSEWPDCLSKVKLYIMEVLGQYRHKTKNVIVAVPDLPEFLSHDSLKGSMNPVDVGVHGRPVKGGECILKIFADAKKATKMIVC
tara:strand:+ start:2473 stop:3927 length:1455 start_codon:yes stop_codon:yes gene_type:complete